LKLPERGESDGPQEKSTKKPIEHYDHKSKKLVNNPPVGLVTAETDKETGKKTYAYNLYNMINDAIKHNRSAICCHNSL
jgi:hypothetical protein